LLVFEDSGIAPFTFCIAVAAVGKRPSCGVRLSVGETETGSGFRLGDGALLSVCLHTRHYSAREKKE